MLPVLSWWSPHRGSKDAQVFFFLQLRDEQGVDRLPPTQGAWTERCAHVQANIWHQDMVLSPHLSRPTDLEVEIDQKLVPVLSRVAPAPVSVLQLVRCNS